MTGDELDSDVRRALSTLPTQVMTPVARHLVMAARLIEDDPAAALEHAEAARRKAARVGVVREAVGITAYRAGRFVDALRELRAAKRLTGSDEHLPLIADCERALGRPDRALELASSPPAGLDGPSLVELTIVAAGARQDLGDPQAALRTLEVAELDAPPKSGRPEIRQARARLLSAYADALEAAGRQSEAPRWLSLAAEADLDGSTGAAERLGLAPDADVFDLEDYADDDVDSVDGDDLDVGDLDDAGSLDAHGALNGAAPDGAGPNGGGHGVAGHGVEPGPAARPASLVEGESTVEGGSTADRLEGERR